MLDQTLITFYFCFPFSVIFQLAKVKDNGKTLTDLMEENASAF